MSPTDTKTQILELAQHLAGRHGFGGFSYRDISEALGIRNAAVHYHFRSKVDLGTAIIRQYRDMLKEHTQEFLESGGDPIQQLRDYIAFYTEHVCCDDRTCPVAMISIDYLNLPEEMRNEGEQLSREVHAWLTRVLDVGRETGKMKFPGQAEDKSVTISATLLGSALLARLRGRYVIGSAVRQIWADLGLEEPEEG